MSARAERLFPILAGIGAAAVAAVVAFVCEIGPLPKPLAAGTMTLGIVVAGFTATQRNMLLGMSGSTVLQFAARTGYYRDVLDYLMHSVYAGIAVSLVSLIGFFLGNSVLVWSIWLVAITGLIALILALILRNEILMVRMVKRFVEEQKRPNR